jgi:hypothetical protein
MQAKSVFSTFNSFQSLNMSFNIAIEEARNKQFQSSLQNTQWHPTRPTLTTRVGGTGVSEALFLKGSVPADNFTKIFFPLATNLSTS